MKAAVSLVRCRSYDRAPLTRAIREAISMAGTGAIASRGTKVFVKFNHLSPLPPERAVTVHPEVIRAVLEILLEQGARPTIGDDIDERGTKSDGFMVSGTRQVSEELGVPLVNLRRDRHVLVRSRGAGLERWAIAKQVLDADLILSLAKFKTHTQTLYTGAVKNMFGTIPPGQRHECHSKFVQGKSLSRAVVDLALAVKPHFSIVDGVLAMEGEGPGAGDPRWLGLLMASSDPIAADTVAARLIGLSETDFWTAGFGQAEGLGAGRLEDIEVRGVPLGEAVVPGFCLPANTLLNVLPESIVAGGYRLTAAKPVIIRNTCTGCAVCEENCPVRAIRIIAGKAVIDDRACIRCLCCHELCRHRAILARRPAIGSAILRLLDVSQRAQKFIAKKPRRRSA